MCVALTPLMISPCQSLVYHGTIHRSSSSLPSDSGSAEEVSVGQKSPGSPSTAGSLFLRLWMSRVTHRSTHPHCRGPPLRPPCNPEECPLTGLGWGVETPSRDSAQLSLKKIFTNCSHHLHTHISVVFMSFRISSPVFGHFLGASAINAL